MARTTKQERFVQEFPIERHATQAAIRAGYNEKPTRNPGALGYRVSDVLVDPLSDDLCHPTISVRGACGPDMWLNPTHGPVPADHVFTGWFFDYVKRSVA